MKNLTVAQSILAASLTLSAAFGINQAVQHKLDNHVIEYAGGYINVGKVLRVHVELVATEYKKGKRVARVVGIDNVKDRYKDVLGSSLTNGYSVEVGKVITVTGSDGTQKVNFNPSGTFVTGQTIKELFDFMDESNSYNQANIENLLKQVSK